MDSIHLIPLELEFAVFSADEIKRISSVRVITGLTFDELGVALPGGLYDPLMGPGAIKASDNCGVCGLTKDCPGHIGHIELAALVYNPFFKKLAQRILSMSCLHCFKVQIKDFKREIIELQLRLIDAGFVTESRELEMYKCETSMHADNETLIKSEDGGVFHPRILALNRLVSDATVKSDMTKINCGDRTALVNSAIERPKSKECIHCKKHLSRVSYLYQQIICYLTAAELREKQYSMGLTTTGCYKVIFADECRGYLRKIYENSPEFLDLLFPIFKASKKGHSKTSPVDLFFMEAIIVTPPKTRPIGMVAGKRLEHPSTNIYRNIIENDAVLRVILKRAKGMVSQEKPEAKDIYEKAKGETHYEKFYNAWAALQSSVDVLLDANLSREKIAPKGLKQILEKKEGLLRKHMMGKRVNFAARTVITPDPNINVDEVGVPEVFARKLSYPTPVTPWNVSQLRKMVMNGPDVYPGANLIEMENSHKVVIPSHDPVQREALAKRLLIYGEQGVKTVHRHIVNGDVALLNRQPSLHRPSIMAHKVRVLSKEKTFRLHYSNCKAYNADFDGDEMNAHFPQNEVARSEAYNLVNVANNYLSPKDGTPLGGLIQDHVIAGVKLSMRGRFFNREDYHQMVYQGLTNKLGDIKLLPPAIVKPLKLWSGKQVLSTIILNIIPGDGRKINLHSSAHIPAKQWQTIPTKSDPNENNFMCEHTVTISNAELLVGVLDKKQYGATTFGLIHCVYELYGGEVSTCLLTAFTKLFTFFLQREGFSLGVKDILVTEEADKKRHEIVKNSREIGPQIIAKALDIKDCVNDVDVLEKRIKEAYRSDPKFRVLLDRKYKGALDEYTNSINKACVPNGLISRFPENNLQLMILSGAKGSLVNAMQISCLLGQIELEGKRPPLMISGKSLPSFPAFETSPKSGGFIDGRFMTGIQPQDFFFHCMAGREGLIDTAVKTSRSGYLQRCLIKHLEGLQINYDLTVRDSDNTVVQFLYGEDGLDIGKAKFLHTDVGRKVLFFNGDAILKKPERAAVRDDNALPQIQLQNKQIFKWQKSNELCGDQNKRIQSAFANFCAELRDEVDTKNPQKTSRKTGRRRIDAELTKLWQKAEQNTQTAETRKLYEQKHSRCPDPVISTYKPDCYFGAVSENLEKIISQHRQVINTKATVRNIMYLKSMKALASPGEPVGLLAAQSIGEPSTQMTLNTFHFAGRGEMNVTLGIPRLREILMMASANIKTPSMDVPILPGKNRSAEKLRIKMNRVTLANILEKIDVSIKTVLTPERATQYQLYLKFLPRKAYQDDFCVKPKKILKYVNGVFFKQLFRALIKQSGKESIVDIVQKEGKTNENNDEEDDEPAKSSNKSKPNYSDEESGNDDDDATNIKLKARKQDDNDYDDPDSNDEIEDANNDDNDIDDDVQLIEKRNSPVNVNEDEDEDKTDNSDEVVQDILKNSMVHEYVYDKETYLWCKITFNLSVRYRTPDISTILKELAEKSVIHEVPNIKRAIICKGANEAQVLKTDGINIVEMFKHNDVLHLNCLYANDIHAISRTYGIEAAASVLIREVENVFKVYGISIDRRHLSLIADYMTFDGSYQPLSRRGMEHSASPLQQMTFESSLQFLRNATIAGRTDELNSPSSRIVLGLPIRNGTGAFDLLMRYQLCKV